LPSKIEAVLQIPVPETITHLRSFLGMCNFFVPCALAGIRGDLSFAY
jgi:hypothetical protein